MSAPDPVLARVAAAALAGQRGEREAARQELTQRWEQTGPAGDPLHRVAVAHALADVQDDSREELAWDLLALDAAGSLTDDRTAQAGVAGPAAGLLPSLHLDLGDDHLRLGDTAAVRRHLEPGRRAAGALGDDGYAAVVRGGLDRLAARLDGAA